MRTLLAFIRKYNAFFLFLIFEIGALIIYGKYNAFQKASLINSTNEVTGTMYSRYTEFQSYLSLQDQNEKLAKENVALRNQLKSSFYVDTVARHLVKDTVFKQQYEYLLAKVINSSINRRNNYLTINRGSAQGIAIGMGVICPDGIVGKIIAVSPHLAIVQSLLHTDSKFSGMLSDHKTIGQVIWGDDYNPHKALLTDVNNNYSPHVGELVTTSGYSLFPTGIAIGRVSNLHTKSGGFFLNMEITLSVDFSKLQYVYVVDNKMAKEQAGLEALQKKDE